MPTRYKAEDKAEDVKDLCPAKGSTKWKKIRWRKTGKGDLVCMRYVQKVYLWDGESADYEQRLLIISATKMSNGNSGIQICLK
ncbi:hypothetical protein BW716_34630 [[Flexibacter] sp. ATCC 35208]|nr:hypothetical protein BW716_34630 [[Flexibacter] sp. ATCC 35208]